MPKLSPPYLRNLDLRTINDAIIEIYRALNVISASADEITFRKSETGAKELVINDKGKKYTDSTKASFTSGTASDTFEVKDLKVTGTLSGKTIGSLSLFDVPDGFRVGGNDITWVMPTSSTTQTPAFNITNAASSNTFISLLALAPYDSYIKFYSGSTQKWKIGNDPTIGVVADQNDFKIEAGTGTSFADSSQLRLNSDGDLSITGDLQTAETAAGSETGKIAVLDSGVIKYRTPAQINVEIGSNVHFMTHNFDMTGSSAVYIPFGGSQLETITGLAGTTSKDEVNFIAPVGGKLIKLMFQSHSAAGSTTALLNVNGSDQAAMSSGVVCSSADTTYTLTLNSGGNSFTGGDRLRVNFNPTNAPDEVTMTSVWNFDKVV